MNTYTQQLSPVRASEPEQSPKKMFPERDGGRILAMPALIVLFLALVVVPASAGLLYSNGPINGQVDGYFINLVTLSATHSRSPRQQP